MTENEAGLRLLELRRALQVYHYVYNRSDSTFRGDNLVDKLIKNVEKDIHRLETALYNGELEDSFLIGGLVYDRD